MPRRTSPVVACPECGGRRVGRISAKQYFCGDCCVEFTLQPARRRIEVFEVDEDGNLVAVGTRPIEEMSRPPTA